MSDEDRLVLSTERHRQVIEAAYRDRRPVPDFTHLSTATPIDRLIRDGEARMSARMRAEGTAYPYEPELRGPGEPPWVAPAEMMRQRYEQVCLRYGLPVT